MITMLTTLFSTVFDRDALLERARQLGAVRRVRELHPADMLLALVRSAVGDEHPSVATARRQLHVATGYMPEESSFYERITPGLGDLGWDVFLRALARATRVQRRQVAKALGLRVRDVRAIDASVVMLPQRASPHLPSTDSMHGGFKITATLSLIEDLLVSAHVTDARQHDRKALVLPKVVRSVLHLMDRGYSDHRLFSQIADGGGYFIIRLKSCSQPQIETIRSGIAKMHREKPLARELPVFGIVDLDARFTIRGTQRRTFRVVGIPVTKNKAGEPDWIWLATNLPERVAATTVGMFYRLRWSIESLFRALKGIGRLDEIQSANPAIIKAFIAATLIGLVLSQSICAIMRAERPRCDPSLLRVFALLLANLGRLAAAFGRVVFAHEVARFSSALWREGVNPNPGRPYARERHVSTVGE
jgi:putative transposase